MHTRIKKFFLLCISLTLVTLLYAQSRQDYVSIKKEFQSINSDKSLKKITLQNEDFIDQSTDGGGELIGFYKGNKIKKIVRSIGLSNGNEIIEFYFKNGELIFVFEQFNSFLFDKQENELNRTKTERTSEGRYSFKDKQLINYVTLGHNRFEDDKNDPEKILLNEAELCLKLIRRKRYD